MFILKLLWSNTGCVFALPLMHHNKTFICRKRMCSRLQSRFSLFGLGKLSLRHLLISCYGFACRTGVIGNILSLSAIAAISRRAMLLLDSLRPITPNFRPTRGWVPLGNNSTKSSGLLPSASQKPVNQGPQESKNSFLRSQHNRMPLGWGANEGNATVNKNS